MHKQTCQAQPRPPLSLRLRLGLRLSLRLLFFGGFGKMFIQPAKPAKDVSRDLRWLLRKKGRRARLSLRRVCNQQGAPTPFPHLRRQGQRVLHFGVNAAGWAAGCVMRPRRFHVSYGLLTAVCQLCFTLRPPRSHSSSFPPLTLTPSSISALLRLHLATPCAGCPMQTTQRSWQKIEFAHFTALRQSMPNVRGDRGRGIHTHVARTDLKLTGKTRRMCNITYLANISHSTDIQNNYRNLRFVHIELDAEGIKCRRLYIYAIYTIYRCENN